MAWDSRRYDEPRGQRGFGGSFGGGGFGSPGSAAGWTISTWLIVINSAVLLLDGIVGGAVRSGSSRLGRAFGFSFEEAVKGLEVWRFFTYQFLHAGLGHLLGNVLILFFFGRMLEGTLGRRRFLAFYLLCGASGAVVASLIGLFGGESALSGSRLLIGASGAAFGILVSVAIRYPDAKVLLWFTIPVKVRTLAIVLLFIAVYIVTSGGPNAGGEAAHLGGALLGFVLTWRPELLRWFGDDPAIAGGFGNAKRSAGGIEGVKQRLTDFQRERKRKAAAAHAAEVDRILAKVSEKGIQSLTSGEKKTLAEDTKQKR